MQYGSRPQISLDLILILITINIALYVVVVISPEWGNALAIEAGNIWSKPWTLLTSMFVHASIFHIFANMLALFFFGSYLLRIMGSRQFLITYFGGGLLGSILFGLLGPSGQLAVGASGAIFALGGALAILQPNLKVFIIPIPVPMPLWIAVIGGFVVLSFLPFVAWEAHLGGIIFGLVSGYLFKNRARRYF